MIPVYLDPAHAQVGVAGDGPLALRRLEWLRALGASPLHFLAPPPPERLKGLAALWIADCPQAEALAGAARALGVLVNVEDERPLCDFHTPAVLTRGALTLAAGAGGASPALSRLVREKLERDFPPAWADAVEQIARDRQILRAQGASKETLVENAAATLRALGLLAPPG